jgi:hypothetical protein
VKHASVLRIQNDHSNGDDGLVGEENVAGIDQAGLHEAHRQLGASEDHDVLAGLLF